MGIETTKALQARRREAAARVDRLLAVAGERSAVASARRVRIKAAVRDGRRALRALGTAEQAVLDLRARVGVALTRLTGDGLSSNDAYRALGVSRAVGRRLIGLPEARRTAADVSTTQASGRAAHPGPTEGEADEQRPGAASNGGIL